MSSSTASLPDHMEESHLSFAAINVNGNNNSNDDDDDDDAMDVAHVHDFKTITLIAKFAKDRITLDGLPPSTTIGQVKEMIREQTHILPKRQKLVGLVAQTGGAKGVHDKLMLSELQIKGKQPSNADRIIVHQFILMGTPEEEIFVDPGEREDLPDVIDDFELDFNAGSEQWMQHVANEENLKSFTEKTMIHIMNPPRPGKPLLVLDLDHTLLDFSSRQLQSAAPTAGEHVASSMKRPYMNEFLTTCYRHFDLVVWSQTSWR
jgi:ubiquitin-like domain-containing CTD phosphatase 1